MICTSGRVLCGTEQSEWLHETEGAATSLWSWLRALATKRRLVRKGGRRSMCWIWGGLSQWTKSSTKSRPCTGFSFVQGVPRQWTHSFFHLCFARQFGSLLNDLTVTERNNSSILTSLVLSHRTVHPIPHTTTTTTCLSCSDAYRRTAEPNSSFLCYLLSPSPISFLPRRCLGLY